MTIHGEKLLRFIILWIICAIVVYLAIWRLSLNGFPIGVDDANIFFVYAKNFSQGHGFVYNIDGERVEGFTSLLWVLICALAYLISTTPEILLLLINITILASALTAISSFIDNEIESEKNSPISFASLVFLSITFSSPCYITWTTFTLMDLGLWSALLVALTLTVLKLNAPQNPLIMSILIMLLLLTRPESMLWGIVFISLSWGKLLILHGMRPALKYIKQPIFIFCISLLAVAMFRLSYFGFMLPNTYYAKVSPSLSYNLKNGAEYLGKYFLFSNGLVLLVILSSIIYILFISIDFVNRSYPSNNPFNPVPINGFIVAIISWVGLLVPIPTGGDHFPCHRFYQAIYPVLVLNIIYIGRYLFLRQTYIDIKMTELGRLKTFTIAVLALLFPLMSQSTTWWYFGVVSRMEGEFSIAELGRKKGAFMTKLFSNLDHFPTVGVITAGGIKLTYEGGIFDLMGLNNIQMGHSKGDRKGLKNHSAFEKDVFFRFSPEILCPAIEVLEQHQPQYDLFSKPDRHLIEWDNQLLKGLYDDPQFQQLYCYARIHVRNSLRPNKALKGFFHKEFLQELNNTSLYVIEVAEIIDG